MFCKDLSLEGSPASHCSPIPTIPSLQKLGVRYFTDDPSKIQDALHPSPPILFPSSQSSPASIIPFPQVLELPICKQVFPLHPAGKVGSDTLCFSQVSPGSRSAFPHTEATLGDEPVCKHWLEHPSLLVRFPSSQSSPSARSPFPQVLLAESDPV